MSKKFILLLSLAVMLSGCDETIVHNLNEADANRSLTALSEVGIHAKKDRQPDGKWSIGVRSGQVTLALSQLSQSRVLRTKTNYSFSSSLAASREEQRFLFERALAQQIEETLGAVPSVLEARVHLHLAAVDPILGRALTRDDFGSASVLLILSKPSELIIEDVASLVSGASGIPSTHVSVVISLEEDSAELAEHHDKWSPVATPEVPKQVAKQTALFSFIAESQWLGVSLLLVGLALGYSVYSLIARGKPKRKATFLEVRRQVAQRGRP